MNDRPRGWLFRLRRRCRHLRLTALRLSPLQCGICSDSLIERALDRYLMADLIVVVPHSRADRGANKRAAGSNGDAGASARPARQCADAAKRAAHAGANQRSARGLVHLTILW